MKILIINGPNLNLLGQREPGIYGSESMEEYLPALYKRYPEVEFSYFQSNVEGELINKMQEAGFYGDCNGIVLNAGAYTHTSECGIARLHPKPALSRGRGAYL